MSSYSKPITRADVRAATIHGIRLVKADPRHLRLTSGQRSAIVNRARAG